MNFKSITFFFSLSLLLFLNEIRAQQDTLFISLDVAELKNIIAQAPLYTLGEKSKTSPTKIKLPNLDGNQEEFYVLETISMEQELYEEYEAIRSYILTSVSDPTKNGRLSTGRDHIYIMTKSKGKRQYISPTSESNKYKLYEGVKDNDAFTCGLDDIHDHFDPSSSNRSAQSTFSNGNTIRTYRMAIAATGEFYQANGNTNATVLAQINHYLNLANDIFEDELAVHFNLIANNTAILFPDPATDGIEIDPTNSNIQLNTTQTVINSTIGAANYDIGHAFYTIPPLPPPGPPCCATSGVASLGIICEDNFKARGWTGANAGSSDDLFIGTFAHEIGHQFGAHHSYYGTENNCFQRSPGNGYEPGSGNSLMSYEGTCGSQNITPEVSTFYFHNHSLEQMVNEMNSKTCHTSTTAPNAIPVTTAPVNKTIPRGTPFELEGSATDADGDIIFYNWEQFDTDNIVYGQNNPSGAPNAAANSTTAPLFRSFDPSTDGYKRVFPTTSDIVNSTQTPGEILPNVSRNMKFRLTSRDFASAGGAVSCAEVDITVDASMGPFDVTSHASASTWTANGSNTATITWNVAGTNTLCSTVDILFSTDRGNTFPHTIVSNTSNDGSHTITIPSLPTSVGRIKVKCSDNYFFDINLGDITINSPCDAVATTFAPDTDISAIQGSSGLNLSLSPEFGSIVSSFAGSITSSDPASSVAVGNTSGGCTNFNGNFTNYDTYTFQVASSGTFTFNGPSNSGLVFSIYEGPFNAGSPCANFISSSATFNGTNVSLGSSVSASLLPGIEYTLLVSSFSPTSPALPANYTLTPQQTIYDGVPPPSAAFSYTYIAVNQATGNIAAVNANSNFTSLPVGNYTVYGLSFETINNVNNSYVGTSFSAFQTDIFSLVICGALSLNTIDLIIMGTGNCPNNYAGANALTGTETGTEDYETDGAIESTQIINASATVDYDSGTSIKLEAPFEVKLGASFHAFIDGCGGTMLNNDSSDQK